MSYLLNPFWGTEPPVPPPPPPPPEDPVYPPFRNLDQLTPVAGWGVIRRNPDYFGPAVRVTNNVSQAIQEVNFTSWALRGVAPYGQENTRISRIYDQWGNDHMLEKSSQNRTKWGSTRSNKIVPIRPEGGLDSCFKTTHTGASAVWDTPHPVWAIGLRRTTDNTAALKPIAEVPQVLGLREDNGRLNSRIELGSAFDWANTNWVTNSDTVQQRYVRLIIDVSQRDGIAYYYVNNVLALALNFTQPMDYNQALNLFLFASNAGVEWAGDFAELHIFSTTGPMTPSVRAQLDSELAAGETGRLQLVYESGVTNSVGNAIIATFNRPMTGTANIADWQVKVNGLPKPIRRVTLNGTSVVFDMDTAAVVPGQFVTLTYFGGNLNWIEEPLDPFANLPVSNNTLSSTGPQRLFGIQRMDIIRLPVKQTRLYGVQRMSVIRSPVDQQVLYGVQQMTVVKSPLQQQVLFGVQRMVIIKLPIQ